jgi:hypothetical protein
VRYARSYQTTVTKVNTDLRSRLEELVPQERERLKEIKSKYGKVSLGDTTVDMAIGGMRGIKGMVWETSLLDPDEACPPVFSTFKFYTNTCSPVSFPFIYHFEEAPCQGSSIHKHFSTVAYCTYGTSTETLHGRTPAWAF